MNHELVAGGNNQARKPRSSRMTRVFLLGSAATACFLIPNLAHAQCAPDPVSSGDDVVCSGVDTDGVYGFGDGISVTVEPGATVTRDGSAAIGLIGSSNLFTNRGWISSRLPNPTDNVVRLRGALVGEPINDVVGVNEGSIRTLDASGYALDLHPGVLRFENRQGAVIDSAGRAAVALSAGFTGKLVNNGTISSTGEAAIDSSTSAYSFATGRTLNILNTSTGIIENSVGFGIRHAGGDALTVTNHGIIRGNQGVFIGNESWINNEAGGLIEGTGGAAARLEGARIVNGGTVRGVGTSLSGGSYFLANSGEVFGDISQLSANTTQDIVNTGRIEGHLDLHSGHDAVEHSGTIVGDIRLGADADIYRDFGGTVGGVLDLGDGDDFFLITAGGTRGTITGGVTAGPGFNSIGYSVDGTEQITPELAAGFSGFAVESRTADSLATLTKGPAAYGFTVSAFGEGGIENLADFDVTTGDAVRFYGDFENRFTPRSAALPGTFGSGVAFVNRGNIQAQNGVALRSVSEATFLEKFPETSA